MKIEQKQNNIKPESKYPFLAVMDNAAPIDGGEGRVYYDISDILVVSLIEGRLFAHRIDGSSKGWEVNDEDFYKRLPSGYEVKLIQE